MIHKIREKGARDKKQVEVIRYFVDNVMEQNSMRGRQARPPLVYEEVMRVAKSAANLIYSGSGVGMGWDFDVGACQFDPYTAGAGSQGDGVGAEGGAGGGGGRRNRKRRGQGDGQGGSQAGAQSGGGGQNGIAGQGGQTAGAGQAGSAGQQGGGQTAQLCRDWNKGPCPFPNSCRFVHKCNRALPGGALCRKDHKSKDH